MNREGADFDIGHPAPARGHISRWLIFFGFLGAPLAWSLQLIANSSIGGLACMVGTGTEPAIGWGSAQPALAVVNFGAILFGFIALAVAYRCYRVSGEEYREGGSLMDAGEGRTRFLSVWGVWTAVLFLLAIGANSIAIVWGELC